MNLKERAREEAKKHFDYLEEHEHHSAYCNGVSDGFIEGAEWGYRQAVEQLRSKEYKNWLWDISESEEDETVADWLLEKAGLKDE